MEQELPDPERELPDPIHTIQDSRYVEQDNWKLDNISLCSSGNIAASGHRRFQSYVCIYSSSGDNFDSRDEPTLLYHKQFEQKDRSWKERYISFKKTNSTEIVTCRGHEVQVIDYKRDLVLRSRKVNGWPQCLSVSESQIFFGILNPAIVYTYDNDLNRIKSIRLKGIRKDWPCDILAVADRLYVCTIKGRAIEYGQNSGNILTEYTTEQRNSTAKSIAVDTKLQFVAVLWDIKQISFYSFSDNTCLIDFNAETGVSTIRISEGGRIVTGKQISGEIKIYDLGSFLSYRYLKENLSSRLGKDDCENLTDFFAMGGEELNIILSSDKPAASFLLALEEKGVIQPSNVDRLEKAFHELKMSPSLCHTVALYKKLRDQISSYDRFLATLSAHLTTPAPAELCDYFHISAEHKNTIISSQNPGLSLLLVLDEMGVIKSSDVESLEKPLSEMRLVQAVAKINEYKETLHEENRWKLQTESYNFKDKKVMFVEFLKRKIKSWYETMTPVPWKKSCQWKSTDLFVGSRLILTNFKSKQNVQNIDENCKLNYSEIFTHEKLKCEIRIILEGDPGGGKTMLSSQLAYDWVEGKIKDVDILVFLPLKIVEDKTLIQAVEEFYIPPNTTLSRSDIESILASDTDSICLLLDGLEEYSTGGRMQAKETSEVMKIMKKEKHSNCKVVITSRSDFAHDLPECPLLILGRFSESERNSYIEKLFPTNTEKQQKIKVLIQENPFILDLCSVPLLFVLVVHNIEDMNLSEEFQLTKVSPFMRSMILTLCSFSTVKHEVDGIRSKFFRAEKMTLGEVAFKGLCKGHQQLSWQKEFMESNVGSVKQWVDSGILVLEEGIVISHREDQDISEIKRGKDKKEKMKKKKKKKDKKQRTQKVEEKGKRKRRQEKDQKEDSSGKPKKETKEREADVMFLGPSTSQNIPKLPVKSEDMVTASIGASEAGVETSKKDEQHGSVVEVEADRYAKRKKTVKRTAGQVPLTVKFLHKVIQEWFAATFFCSTMKMCSSGDQLHNYVSSQLQHISPTDLHYLLRFTSYLHPPSCHVIIKYLLRNYLKEGFVPPYIMNCVFLCFNEHNDDKGPDMRNAVQDVCKEVITIQSEDSRLLQQAKAALLNYASNNKVTIEKLHLRDVISSADQKSLILNSGVHLETLHTAKLIEVSRWDQVLDEEDYKNILQFLSAGNMLKEVSCIFPKTPPKNLDEVTLRNIASKDITVKWHIGNYVHSLDPIKGTWMTDFKLPGSSLLKKKDVSENEGALQNYEEKRREITSSVPGSSKEFRKYLHTQGTLKRVGSDDGVETAAVPEKKAKVVLEEPAKSDLTKEAREREPRGVSKKSPNDRVEVLDFRKEAVASVVEQRHYAEEKTVKNVVHQFNQENSATVGESFNEDGSVQRVAFDEHSLMSSPGTTKSPTPKGLVEGHLEEHSGTTRPREVDAEAQSSLETKIVITKNGGVLEVPNTGVVLQIPPYALPHDKDQCEIHVRIIPGVKITEQTSTFSSNGSTVVELLPNDLRFQRPVRLSLPHCLVLDETKERNARVLLSHHKKGSKPQWEEHPHLSYHLEDTACIILLDCFSWVKISVDDEIVEAKKLVVYTAARKLEPQDQVAEIHIGYYLDLPGLEKQVLESTPDLAFSHRKTFYFVRTNERTPLSLSLDNVLPSGWQNDPTEDYSKEIEYNLIEEYDHYFLVYRIEKKTSMDSDPLCIFTVSQGNRQINVQLSIHIKIGCENCLPGRKLNPSFTMAVTNAGGRLEIDGTGVLLSIPPNALPADMDQCMIRINIVPSRIHERQVKSICSNSSTAVEISPCNIRLKCPAQLSLPHCLKFEENKERENTVKIFTNLESGSPSPWKEKSDIKYELKEDTCIIRLDVLCCVKYYIDDSIVKAKKIVMYTTAKPIRQKDDLAEIEVGYYSDIPLGGELLRLNRPFAFNMKRKFHFQKKETSPLQVSLKSVLPQQWTCLVPKKKLQEIPFNVIASLMEHSHLYVLQKMDDQLGSISCKFSACQKGDRIDLSVRLNPQTTTLQGSSAQASEQTSQDLRTKLEADEQNRTIKLLSKKLRDEWRDVCRSLGVEGSIFCSERNNQGNIQESIYQCLLSWKESSGCKATFKTLCSALEENGRADLADDVKKYQELFS